MPSKKSQKALDKISGLFKSKKEEPVIREDITADMRKNAQIIIGILSATDIEGGKLSDEIKNAGKAECGDCDEELHRLGLIEELQKAPAISDDMRCIDSYMVKFAQYYKEACEQGQNNAFHWAGNALAKGLTLRQNLRHEDEEFRRNDLNHRLQMMEDYDNLITSCKALDEAIRTDAMSAAKYHENAAAFNAAHKKIIDFLATNQGSAAQDELDRNPRQADGIWSDGARTLNGWYNDLVRGEQGVVQSAIWMDENKETLASYQDMFQKFREALQQNSGIYDDKLAAEFTVLLDRQRKLLEKTMVRNNDIREKMHKHTRDMKVIATESEQAKVREYWREEAKQMAIDLALKNKQIQEAGPSKYAALKQPEVQVNTQRVMNSME